jgi:FecR protein
MITKLSWKAMQGIFLTVALSALAWGANTALPGTINYVEGHAAIGAQVLDSKSIGSADLRPGQTLATENGKAELLLTPGVFLRLDSNSSAQMISPSLTKTEVTIDKGDAMVEVAELHRENDLRIREGSATARLVKTGLYDFDAAHNQIRVFDGKAVVQDGDRQVTVKGGHEVNLAADGKLKAYGFDKKEYKASDLYRFSSLRSSYLAEANVDVARVYYVNGWYGPGWIGSGWYWDPWFSSYTFIPADGFFYSPFGWGFYSPLSVYGAPIFYGGPYYHHFGHEYRPAYAYGGHVAPRGPVGRGFGPGPAAHPGAAMGPSHAFNGGFSGGFHGGGGFGGRR